MLRDVGDNDPKTGFFVAVEGVDGSGKSHLIDGLKSFFQGGEEEYRYLFLKEPSSFLRREIMAGHGWKRSTELNALLFAADRLLQYDEVMRGVLEDGKAAITDRSVVSSLAYQGAAGVSLEWIKAINRYVRFPDLVILLDMPAEKALARAESSEESAGFEEKVSEVEFQKKVREKYLELAEKYSSSFYILRSDHYSSSQLVRLASEEIQDRVAKNE